MIPVLTANAGYPCRNSATCTSIATIACRLRRRNGAHAGRAGAMEHPVTFRDRYRTDVVPWVPQPLPCPATLSLGTDGNDPKSAMRRKKPIQRTGRRGCGSGDLCAMFIGNLNGPMALTAISRPHGRATSGLNLRLSGCASFAEGDHVGFGTKLPPRHRLR